MALNGSRWSVVTVALSAVALVVSLTILQGQVHGRIDALRGEVLTEVRALRVEMRAEFHRLNGAAALAPVAAGPEQ